MLNFVFRLFELNRRIEICADFQTFNLSDLEKEGVFIVRDELKRFDAAEMIRISKKRHG